MKKTSSIIFTSIMIYDSEIWLLYFFGASGLICVVMICLYSIYTDNNILPSSYARQQDIETPSYNTQPVYQYNLQSGTYGFYAPGDMSYTIN